MKRTLIVALLAALLLTPQLAQAQDPAFVGVLALAVEDKVAKELGLSDEVKKQLDDLIKKREDEILKAGVDQLPEDEQKAKLAAFVADSEKQGLALLSKEQQAKLMQIRIARSGLSTLANADVAEKVGLDEKQRSNIAKMLDSLNAKLTAGTEQERRIAKLDLERGLATILKPEQRAAWEKLAGLKGAGQDQGAEAVAKVDDEAEPPEGAEEKPAEEKDADDAKPAVKTDERKPEAGRPGSRRSDDKKPELSKSQPPKDIEDVRLRINFSYTPWKDVLEWLAKEADLSLVSNTMPPGTCNYRDSRSYTVAQTIDILNGQLQLRGFTLVRRDRMLFVWDMEDGPPPPHIAPLVTPAELDERGEFELLTCIFPLTKLTPEQVEADVLKLKGPGGSVSVLSNLKQLSVTETGGKLRAIRDIIKQAEEQSNVSGDTAVIKLKNRTTDEVMGPARQLMGIPEGTTQTPDGSLRIAVRVNGFIVQGKADAIDRFKKLVEELDDDDGVESEPVAQPQVVVYPIATADPDAVLQVLQTVMAGQVGVRLAKDPKTGSIIAHGTPAHHATIKALIDEMQQDKRSYAVIRLKKLDPEEVVTELNKLLGIIEGQNNPSQPKIVANTTTNHISVFGSKQQIDQIKAYVIEMGETPANSDPTATIRSNTRSIPLTGRQLESALRQFEAIAPVYFTNEFRVVRTPSAAGGDEIPSRIPVPKEWEKNSRKPAASSNTNSDSSRESRGEDEDRYRGWGSRGWGGRGFDFRGGGFPGGDFRGGGGGDDRRREGDGERSRDEDRRSQLTKPARYYYVAWQDPEAAQEASDETADDEKPAPEQPEGTAKPSAAAAPKQKTVPGAEIVITITPNGIILSSEDLDALDKAEEMLAATLTESPGKEYTVFYLRYARADVAADLLSQAMGGGSGDDGGGGSLLGDVAGSMFGGGGGMGGLMGAMLGGGGGSSMVSSGPVLMIPDNRLNAIVAQGKPSDLDLAESLLKIIDQRASLVDPEVIAKPKFIPVYHTTAAEMAETIKQVYANRMVAPAGQGQQQISPQQLMQALAGGGRRGRGGGGGGGNDRKSEEQKMTIGVDEKSNSLIVSAPPALFDEIKDMVEALDIASSQKEEFVQTIKTSANATMLEQQLTSILGEDVSITRVGGTTTSTANRGNTQRNNNASRTGNNQNRNQRQQGQPQFNQQFNPQQFPGIQGFTGAGGGGNRGGGGGGNRGGGGGGNRGGGGR